MCLEHVTTPVATIAADYAVVVVILLLLLLLSSSGTGTCCSLHYDRKRYGALAGTAGEKKDAGVKILWMERSGKPLPDAHIYRDRRYIQ